MPNFINTFSPVGKKLYGKDADGNVGFIGADQFNQEPKLNKFSAALAKTLAGVSNTRICLIGDSTTTGLWTTGGQGLFSKSPSSIAAAILSRNLCNVSTNSIFGDCTRQLPNINQLATFDTRFSGGTSWLQTGVNSAGGNAFGNATTTNPLIFTPVDQFDTIDIYSLDNTGGTYGTWTVNIDGGATLATVNNAQAVRAIRKTTVSCAFGNHAVNIQRNGTGGQVFIFGIVCSDSSKKVMEIFNLGSGSTTSAVWNDAVAVYGYKALLQYYAANLYIIDLGINERRIALYTETFKTNMQALITAAKISGDVILCLPTPTSFAYSAYTTEQNIADYNDAIRDLATTNGCLLWDKELAWGQYADGQLLGYYSDTIHPKDAGYAHQGRILSRILLES